VINDIHCHFFSPRFFETLARDDRKKRFESDPPAEICALLGWEPPESTDALAARWVAELDRQHVRRAVLIASVPGDEASVAAAVAHAPARLVGFFMLNPLAEDAGARVRQALGPLGLRGVCLFPAMQRYSLHDPRVLAVVEQVAGTPGAVLFVHCGVLTVGIRRKLELPSRFDMRFSNPLDLHALALAHPSLPIVVPHFGAGLFREALMLADLCPNVLLDTSSSNHWIDYHAGLTLTDVFRQALLVAGPRRLVFGTDSSFFPRGWNRAVWDAQIQALQRLSVAPGDIDAITGGNFDRLFAGPDAAPGRGQ
jgi:predicted TIM-barrel fold metal-dependent hydrolase